MNRGWIQKSKSAYSSPVVCVRKKDGSLRLCVDYRQLNSKTVCDSHPLPRIQDDVCTPYIDDIIVFSQTFEDHVDHIRGELRRLREHGFKLKQKKCRLFKQEVNYLGQIVSAAGYRLDHSNVEAVRTLKDSKPSTVGEVRRLLGLLGYYRRYI